VGYAGEKRETISKRRRQALEIIGVPNRIRTGVAAVKGRCPRPLDDGDPVKRLAMD
jgi:hypothetical protein